MGRERNWTVDRPAALGEPSGRARVHEEPTLSPSVSTPAVRLAALSIPVTTERLRLEHPSLRRADEYPPLLDDRAVSRWLLRVPWPYHRSDAVAHVLRARRRRRSGTHLALAIIELDSDRLIGGIGLYHLEGEHRHAEVGYWLGRPYWGQGFASEALGAVLRAGFVDLRLHRVEAGVFPGNAASEHVLRKAGFVAEGIRREAFFKGGVWVDDLLFGLTVTEWRRTRSRRGHAGPRPG